MGAILSSNGAVLEKRYPAAYAQMMKKEAGLPVEWVDARDGSTALIVQKDDEKIRLNSTYQPVREAAKWAEQYDYKNLKTNIFMFGMGNGIFVREILSRMRPDAKLFVLEPDGDILFQVLRKIDISELLSDERLALIIDTMDSEGLEKQVGEYMNWSTIPTQILCYHPGYDKLYPQDFMNFHRRLQRMTIQASVMRNTNAEFAGDVLRNTIHNMVFIRESSYLAEVPGRFPVKGVPAIIVSAGPSLSKNIEQLRKARDKAFLMVVDSAVKHLDEKGIAYDCVVSIDPIKPVETMGESDAWKNVPMFCDVVSNYDITSAHRGKKIWYMGKGFLAKLYERQGVVLPECIRTGGGSVATVAFAIAEFLGFETIVLVGQDLAYQGEATHAGGIREYYIKDEEASVKEIDGIDGQQVKSRWDWIYYRDWFEERIAYNKHLKVIDATEGGALIHGSEVSTLAEAIEKYCGGEFSFQEELKKISPTFDAESYGALRQDLLHIEKELDNVRRKTEEGVKYCEEYFRRIGTMDVKRHNRLMRDIEQVYKYVKLQEIACILLDMYTSQLAMEDIKDINRVTGDPVQDERNSVKNAQVIYSAYYKGAAELKEMVRGAGIELMSRGE